MNSWNWWINKRINLALEDTTRLCTVRTWYLTWFPGKAWSTEEETAGRRNVRNGWWNDSATIKWCGHTIERPGKISFFVSLHLSLSLFISTILYLGLWDFPIPWFLIYSYNFRYLFHFFYLIKYLFYSTKTISLIIFLV